MSEIDWDDCRVRWAELSRRNPGIDERIAEMVADWPAVPEEAMTLWGIAKRDCLQQLAQAQAEK